MSIATYLDSQRRIGPRNITNAAISAYEGSSFRTCPWNELPEPSQTLWKQTVAHLLAPKGERHSAVQLVYERARRERIQALANGAELLGTGGENAF
jgi:hypothetical protein